MGIGSVDFSLIRVRLALARLIHWKDLSPQTKLQLGLCSTVELLVSCWVVGVEDDESP